MTEGQALHARVVYSDALEASRRLEATLRDQGNWRIDWFAAVALLRTIGHVLVNVDKPSGVSYPVPEHPIFSEFIKPERDNAVKEYALGLYAPEYLLLEDGGKFVLEDGSAFLLLETPNFEKITDALEWWDGELRRIETIGW